MSPLLETLTEAQFQRNITDLCDLLGLKWHHETDSRRSPKGFPDLVIAGHEDRGVVFAELKRKGGRVSREQAEWVDRLKKAGATVYIWWPADWPEVESVLLGLAGRRVV